MPEILQVLDDNMQPLPFAYAGHASEYTTSAPLTDSCGSLVISNFPIPNCCAFYTVSASGSKPFGQAQTKSGKESQQPRVYNVIPDPNINSLNL
jgi:hypothetical protein